jgi:diacylglycerol kinase
MPEDGNYISLRIKSFLDAFNGLFYIIKTQANFRIQAILGVLAITLGFILNISVIEWCLIILLIGLVLGLEAINSSLEILCDKVEQDYNESIKRIKDIAAFAVLIISISALIIGSIIFLPKIIDQFIMP